MFETNDPGFGGNWGLRAANTVGPALQQGLSTGLQNLAALKLQQYQQRQMAQAAGKAAQYSPEEIALLGMARSPQESFKIMQMLSQGGGGQQQQVQTPKPGWHYGVQEAPTGLQALANLAQNQAPAMPQPAVQNVSPYTAMPELNLMGGMRPPAQQAQPMQAMPSQQPIVNPATGQTVPLTTRQKLGGVVGTPQMAQKERLAAQRMEQSERHFQQKNAIELHKMNKAAIEKLRTQYTKSDERIASYERIIKAAESGQLRSGNMQQLMKKAGMGEIWRNPTTEMAHAEMEGLAKGFVDSFNISRPNMMEFKAYKDAMVTAANNPEGIIAISKNKIIGEKANKLGYEAYRDVLKEHGGTLPLDWQDEVFDKIGPKLQELKSQADSNLTNTIAKTGGVKLTEGSTFDTLPDAATAVGRYFTDDSGQGYMSNGNAYKKAHLDAQNRPQFD